MTNNLNSNIQNVQNKPNIAKNEEKGGGN